MQLFLSVALGGAIDNLEIGGPWGTPTSVDGTAPWWNPAGVAMDDGLRSNVELAYIWGSNHYERSGSKPGSADMGGASPAPFVGLAHTTSGGFGFGASLAVPYATGGSEQYRGSNAYFTRRGGMTTAYGILSAAYRPSERLSFGLSVAGVHSSMSSIVDQDTVPDLHGSIAEMGEESPYTDSDLENPDYAAIIELGELTDTAVTAGGGLQAWLSPNLLFGASFWRGYELENRGDIVMHFQCPPESDTVGRFGAESRGICHQTLPGHASSSYTMPHRASVGLAWYPQPWTRLEVMGGWVGWSVQQDLRVDIYDVAAMNPEMDPEAAALMERSSVKARDLQDSWWGGVDLKHELSEQLLVGGRVLYDTAAVPTDSLNPSNADYDTLQLGGLLAVNNGGPWQLGLSYTHHIQTTRTVSNSHFSMSLDEQRLPEERYQAPSANGTYSGRKDRLGATLRVRF